MEHAKKLMLVDPRLYRPTTKERTLTKLDTDIESTLNSDLPDDEKAKRYLETLHKFRAIDDFNDSSKQLEKRNDIETEVIDSVPSTQQYKAKRLMNYFKKVPDIEWSEKGELIYRQHIIPNSHIIDLVSDILKKKTVGKNPEGWQEIVNILREANVPREFVPNAQVWKRVRESKTQPDVPVVEEEEEQQQREENTNNFVSPKRKRTPRKKRNVNWLSY